MQKKTSLNEKSGVIWSVMGVFLQIASTYFIEIEREKNMGVWRGREEWWWCGLGGGRQYLSTPQKYLKNSHHCNNVEYVHNMLLLVTASAVPPVI